MLKIARIAPRAQCQDEFSVQRCHKNSDGLYDSWNLNSSVPSRRFYSQLSNNVWQGGCRCVRNEWNQGFCTRIRPDTASKRIYCVVPIFGFPQTNALNDVCLIGWHFQHSLNVTRALMHWRDWGRRRVKYFRTACSRLQGGASVWADRTCSYPSPIL